jgi:hypothetical protein
MSDALLHATVRKHFGVHGWYTGKVTEVWWRGNYEYARVLYEDGDGEDLFVADARALVVAGGASGSCAAAPVRSTVVKREQAAAAAVAMAPTAAGVAARPSNRRMTDIFTGAPAPAGAQKRRCARYRSLGAQPHFEFSRASCQRKNH